MSTAARKVIQITGAGAQLQMSFHILADEQEGRNGLSQPRSQWLLEESR